LKIAPTVASEKPRTTVQVFVPAGEDGLGEIEPGGRVQLEDQPPNLPELDLAVIVTAVLRGYVAVQTEPPFGANAGPQWITFAVPVADGAVICQLVVSRPSL
jgi:hypothetical protein